MAAVASNGWAVNSASEELRGDREVMEAALECCWAVRHDRYNGIPVGVKVMLLSGKCCSKIFLHGGNSVEDVVHVCGNLLGLDVDQLRGSATLMHGTAVVTDLSKDLVAGEMHELSLVLS